MTLSAKNLVLSALFAAACVGSYMIVSEWNRHKARVAAQENAAIWREQARQQLVQLATTYAQCLREKLSPAGLKAFLIHEYGYVGFAWKEEKHRYEQLIKSLDAQSQNLALLSILGPDKFLDQIPITDTYNGEPSMALAEVKLGKKSLTWSELATVEAECRRLPRFSALNDLLATSAVPFNPTREQIALYVFHELKAWSQHYSTIQQIELENRRLLTGYLGERSARIAKQSEVSRTRDSWILK